MSNLKKGMRVSNGGTLVGTVMSMPRGTHSAMVLWDSLLAKHFPGQDPKVLAANPPPALRPQLALLWRTEPLRQLAAL
jgi:hypothetical protein